MSNDKSDKEFKSAAAVSAEDMDFETPDDEAVATKVGTVGWPEGAENEQGVGPGSDEPNQPEPQPSEPSPQPTPSPTPQPAPEQPNA
jgi:hypothetical protein